MGGKRAVFLDRDGTINADSPHYIKSLGEFCFLPGAFAALQRLALLEAAIVVVTNQGVIGRKVVAVETIEGINRHMVEAIEAQGGRVTAVYYCPHAPWRGCACRKPRPGLLLAAAADFDIDLTRSFMVGDRETDMVAGRAAGCTPVLLAPQRPPWAAPDLALAADLSGAVDRIEALL